MPKKTKSTKSTKITSESKIIYNKKGDQIAKEIKITPKGKNKLNLFEVDKVYKKLFETKGIDKSDINIRFMTIDGYKTAKQFDNIEDTLIHTLDDYYSSLPKEKKEKFMNLMGIIITVRE